MLTSSALALVITATCPSQGDVGSGPFDTRCISGEFSVCLGCLMVDYGKFGYCTLYFGLEVNALYICSAGITLHETVFLCSSYHLNNEHRHVNVPTQSFLYK